MDLVVIQHDNLIIDNVCACKGPDFAACDILLYSAIPREIRLKSTGVLNLTSFDDPSKLLHSWESCV
jgi:hypothetical protein